MPLFEFTCRACGHVFEELLTLAEVESGSAACPSCGSARVERLLSGFATGTAGPGATPGACSGGCGSGGFT